MTTHARLTEDSLRTHPRKGREGNKEGKGREARERSHHIVTLVDARGAQSSAAPAAGPDRDAMVEALTRPIYHYTCDDHGRPGIERDGVIRPGLDGFAWFTDLDVPHREALGLTMHHTRCDRTAHRFEVDPDDPALTPWTVARRAVSPAYRAALEASPGALLRHWFVAETPVRVIA